jgi:hypothetical protein
MMQTSSKFHATAGDALGRTVVPYYHKKQKSKKRSMAKTCFYARINSKALYPFLTHVLPYKISCLIALPLHLHKFHHRLSFLVAKLLRLIKMVSKSIEEVVFGSLWHGQAFETCEP